MLDEFINQDVQLLFYLHTTEFQEVKRYLVRWDFNYPVIIDYKNTFYSVNKISEERLYRVMLLDENNEVKLIGNPIVSQEVKKMYFDLLTKSY